MALRRCLFCATEIDAAATVCPHCDHDPTVLPTRETPYAVPKDSTPIARVRVIDIDMPFGSIVIFMLKWTLATIPAFLILAIIGFFVMVFFGAIGATMEP